MITNFEKYTEPLSEKEKEWIPYVVYVFETYAFRRDHFLSAKKFIDKVERAREIKEGRLVTFNDRSLRKIVNHLSVNAMLPIGSSVGGYFLITSEMELVEQITSLRERSSAISSRANGLACFSGKFKVKEEEFKQKFPLTTEEAFSRKPLENNPLFSVKKVA